MHYLSQAVVGSDGDRGRAPRNGMACEDNPRQLGVYHLLHHHSHLTNGVQAPLPAKVTYLAREVNYDIPGTKVILQNLARFTGSYNCVQNRV